MSNEVKRVSRELAYTGTVLKIYKDRMEFSMAIMKTGILFTMTERLP